jgi:3-oxoacyl-[acyl-carrier-protein] synthase I
MLMMRDGFIAGTGPVDSLDPLAQNTPLVQASREARIDRAMSISFGFGGSCASLMFAKVDAV